MEYAIETENLTKKFGDFIAVDNLDFTIEKGEIFGLLGKNDNDKNTGYFTQAHIRFCRSMAPQYFKRTGCR